MYCDMIVHGCPKDTVIKLLLLFVLLFSPHWLWSFYLFYVPYLFLAIGLPCFNKLELSWVECDRLLTLSTTSLEKLATKLQSAGTKCRRVPVQTSLNEGSVVICMVPWANISKVSDVTTRLGHPSAVQARPTNGISSKQLLASVKLVNLFLIIIIIIYLYSAIWS